MGRLWLVFLRRKSAFDLSIYAIPKIWEGEGVS